MEVLKNLCDMEKINSTKYASNSNDINPSTIKFLDEN